MKYIVLSFMVLTIFTPLFADTTAPCSSRPVVILDSQKSRFIQSNKDVLKQLAKPNLKQFGATTSQIRKSPCRKLPPTEKEVSSYLNLLSSQDRKKTANTRGVLFEDESPQLIEVFKNLTTMHDIFGGASKEQLNIQKKYAINPKCKKVICAAKKIFGKKLGLKLLYMNQKYGLNGSHLSFEDASKLKLSEVDRLIVGVNDFPQSTFPMNKNKKFTKFKRGYTLAIYGPGVIANATISFFDNWLDLESNEMMEYTVLHELAHYTAGELNLDDDPNWLAFSGWTEKNGKWSATRKNTFVSEYAQGNPHEDFAESVATYRYNPKQLKAVSPEKYTFIKETVFHGIEYTSEKKCQPLNLYKNILNKKVADKISTFNSAAFLEKEGNLKKAIRPCKNESMNFIINNSSETLQSLDECISKGVGLSFILAELDKISPPLKYSALVKKKLTEFPPKTDVPKVEKVGKVHFEARKLLKDIVTSALYESHNRSFFLYPGEIKSSCKIYSNTSYQSLEKLDRLFNDEFLTFRKREEIDALVYETCIETFGHWLKPVSKKTISASLPITIYTKKEIEKIKVSLSFWRAQKRDLMNALSKNGITFKVMYYLKYQKRIQELDNLIEKAELQIK